MRLCWTSSDLLPARGSDGLGHGQGALNAKLQVNAPTNVWMESVGRDGVQESVWAGTAALAPSSPCRISSQALHLQASTSKNQLHDEGRILLKGGLATVLRVVWPLCCIVLTEVTVKYPFG